MKTRLIIVGFITLLSLTNIGRSDLEDVEALWRFDEGSGSTVRDSSGNGYDGTIQGDLTWTDGVFKGALQFTGAAGDRVEVSNYEGVVGRADRTTLAWIKTTGAGTIISWGSEDARWVFDIYTQFQGTPGAPRMLLVGGFIVGSTDVRDGDWHHVAAVLESAGAPRVSDIRLYVDGVQEAISYLARGVVNTGNRAVWIGDGPNQYFPPFTGALDEVAVFSRALSKEEIREAMDGLGKKEQAHKPHPTDENPDIPRDIRLSWAPGDFADSHDVYLGTVQADVEAASVTNPLGVVVSPGQTDNMFDPDILTFGQTYYWRVDEVNAPPTSHVVFKGEVWSFTVEPLAYPIGSESITASASSSGPGLKSENTINGSGLDDNDGHSSDGADMWLSGSEEGGAWIQYEFEKAYKLHQMLVWNHNTSFERLVGTGVKEASIAYSLDGLDWAALGSTHEFAKAPGTPGYVHDTTVDFDNILAKHVKITANSNWGGILPQYGLSEVRFLYIPLLAREPNPESGANDVALDVTLKWRTGREAALHNVYFGTDPNALTLAGSVAELSFDTASLTLVLGQNYYWRVDEVNEAETPTIWQGDLWSFSTQQFLVVDDFESYNDVEAGQKGSNLVYLTWIDGFDNPAANGSTMGYVEPFQPTMERQIVHGGKQSAPLIYNNNVASLSEVTVNLVDLAVGRDWTMGSPQTLVLYFYGDPGNIGGQLYVKINNVKVPFNGDHAAISAPFWTQWNVDLGAAGVDLARVNTLTIGIEGAGAQGILYIDDIRLYRQAPEALIPQDPGTSNLVAYYAMENNAQDSSGNGHHGTSVGGPVYAPSMSGMAMDFDGTDDFVDLGPLDVVGGGITLSLWLNPENYAHNDARALSKAIGVGENDHWWMLSTQGLDRVLRFRLKTDDGEGTTTLLADSGGVSTNEWTHAAATWDGSAMRIYHNLLEVGSMAKGGGAVAVDAGVGAAIGNQPLDAGDKHWDGLIDEVRIYNRALSQSELLHIASEQ